MAGKKLSHSLDKGIRCYFDWNDRRDMSFVIREHDTREECR
jgi:hypothetical protein